MPTPDWTPAKLEALNEDQLKALEANAHRLLRADIVELIVRERVRRSSEKYDDELRAEIERGIKLFEELKSAETSRKYHASRTRQMRERHGDVGFVSKLVLDSSYSEGFETMEKHGYLDLTAERLATRFADRFLPVVVRAAEAKLARRASAATPDH